jgi:hypothetical protein
MKFMNDKKPKVFMRNMYGDIPDEVDWRDKVI